MSVIISVIIFVGNTLHSFYFAKIFTDTVLEATKKYFLLRYMGVIIPFGMGHKA